MKTILIPVVKSGGSCDNAHTSQHPVVADDKNVNSVATADRLIMETTDATLVRKLHGMRAAGSVFEHEHERWTITRIVLTDELSAAESTWAVYGRRARR
jgi:hypothetical protein